MPKFEKMNCVFCANPLVHVIQDAGYFACHCDSCGSTGPLCKTVKTAKSRWTKGLKK